MTDGNRYWLERMLEMGELLMRTIDEEGIAAETLQSSYKLQWLVSAPLYNIGEQAYRLSREFKDAYPQVEWAGIAGLGHRLVRDYEGTNWRLVASIASTELSELVSAVRELLSECS